MLSGDACAFSAGGDRQKIAPLLAGIRDASLLGLRRLDLQGCGLETLPEEVCQVLLDECHLDADREHESTHLQHRRGSADLNVCHGTAFAP